MGRCCAASGYSCFKTSSGKGQCMKECTPGGLNGTCEGVAPHMKKVAASPGGSLFCFSCYTSNTGSEKPSHELELLQMQHDDQSGGREGRFPLREAQRGENMDQHGHVRADLDSTPRRRPCDKP